MVCFQSLSIHFSQRGLAPAWLSSIDRRMKRYVPIPEAESRALAERVAHKSLDEIIAMFGPPVREHDASRFETRTVESPPKITRYSRVLEFSDVSPSVCTMLAFVQEHDGKLAFEFRGPELVQAHS